MIEAYIVLNIPLFIGNKCGVNVTFIFFSAIRLSPCSISGVWRCSPTLYALNPSFTSAKKAVEMFVTFYGRFAGNIAKVNLPRGGLYLAGGVTTHIVSHMKSSFVREFEKTLPIADLKDEIPLYLINDHHLALLGCGMFYLKNPNSAR